MIIQYEPITQENYSAYLQKCKQTGRPSLFLPTEYCPNIWGILAKDNDRLLGGWVGKLRGNKPVVKYFVLGVWFDSLPNIFETNKNDDSLLFNLIEISKKQAKEYGIITLNITHWSRQQILINKIFDIEENNATILLNLKADYEVLWKGVSSKLRNIIRKGEKNNVEVLVVKNQDAVNYLTNFQHLRQNTQVRAIKKNAQASMLLKSNTFFTNLLSLTDSCFFIAKNENAIVAMALMITNAQTMYYFSGGSDLQANKNTGASSYLIWKAIEYAKENNLEFFDMGGVPLSPDETHPAYGVYFFKKSFGGEYKEFSSGKIIIRKSIYPIINYILNNRIILRMLSKRE